MSSEVLGNRVWILMISRRRTCHKEKCWKSVVVVLVSIVIREGTLLLIGQEPWMSDVLQRRGWWFQAVKTCPVS